MQKSFFFFIIRLLVYVIAKVFILRQENGIDFIGWQ